MTQRIVEAMKNKYKLPRDILMLEVRNTTGYRTRERYADAIVIGMYPSDMCFMRGYEFKTSKTDLRREMANPDKSRAIKQYCNQWWLVTTAKALSGVEIPEDWGIMIYKDGELQIARRAPALTPKLLDRWFVASLARNIQRTFYGEMKKVLDRFSG